MAATTTTIALVFTLLSVLFFSSTQWLSTLGFVAADHGTSLKLFPTNSLSPPGSERSLSWLDKMQSNDKDRVQYLSRLAAGRTSDVPMAHFQNNYIVQAMIGANGQRLNLSVDTNNDNGLVACRPCTTPGCPRNTFNPIGSKSFRTFRYRDTQCKQVPGHYSGQGNCWFNRQFVNTTVMAKLGQDSIAFGRTLPSFPYVFGCAFQIYGKYFPAQGMLGLGRGPLSLMNQTGKLYKKPTFSYCLPSFTSAKSGSLRLGPNGQPMMTKTTPLHLNDDRPSLHIASLASIKVPGTKTFYIPRGSKDTVIDTGTVFTTLVDSTYWSVRNAVRSLMGRANCFALGAFDTCYDRKRNPIKNKVPNMTFVFESGMTVTIPSDNFIINNCLAMMPSPKNINYGLNFIASYQQQNLRVLFNDNSVGIVNEQCS